MPANTIEKKALSLLTIFERAGKQVNRVTIEGRKIELDFSKPEKVDEFEGIDLRHDKT